MFLQIGYVYSFDILNYIGKIYKDFQAIDTDHFKIIDDEFDRIMKYEKEIRHRFSSISNQIIFLRLFSNINLQTYFLNHFYSTVYKISKYLYSCAWNLAEILRHSYKKGFFRLEQGMYYLRMIDRKTTQSYEGRFDHMWLVLRRIGMKRRETAGILSPHQIR